MKFSQNLLPIKFFFHLQEYNTTVKIVGETEPKHLGLHKPLK